MIVPHAVYVYSGSVAALAYALLERAPHSARRAGRA
ncbi:AmmeMemoRadiSam system protein B [Bifidobacterium bifidum]